MVAMASTAIAAATGATCKAFLNSGLCSITVTNLSVLLDALNSNQRPKGQGVITVANHISVLDDPVTWGILPLKCHFQAHTRRWALGASDIIFTNPLFSAFFKAGQVLETHRGAGIYQPAVDSAISKLNEGGWVHLFGEGKVNQPDGYPSVNGIANLPRFKWGMGRIIMESAIPPIIIPMWLSGFNKLMPEHRPFPNKYIPRLGVKLGVAFGDPLPPRDITTALHAFRQKMASQNHSSIFLERLESTDSDHIVAPHGDSCLGGRTGYVAMGELKVNPKSNTDGQQLDQVRSDITAILQRAVEALGRNVAGDMLNR
ncbi:acyltransferase-domain-containing protein [Hygrophoropsis aurantiaca]|uniref:Acyltransferase-domain-containing protein n=1 Tax=Hygrophoropsis aurantiaca TaxID=72124 RepID=A0ACB8ALG2_9AGAM|nr:acyltransferase-domain-containing protein [Hygrophoropsis aurantiaca]